MKGLRITLFLIALTVSSRLLSQEVIIDNTSTDASAIQQAGVAAPKVTVADSQGIDASSTESPFTLGPLAFKPHYLYRLLYGNGIQASPGHPLVTAVNSFSPGFALDIGNIWIVDYTPMLNLYSNHALRDSLDEALTVSAKNSFDNWTLQFSQGYRYSADPLIETGRQTSEQEYTTKLDLTHQLTSNILAESIFDQDLQFAEGYSNSLDWSIQNWIHYRFASRIDTALGCGAGYDEVTDGPNAAYVQPQAQLSIQPSDKIWLNLTGGVEYRQYFEDASSGEVNPIYNAQLTYIPFDTTKFVIIGGSEVTNSLFFDQTTRNTQWSVSLDQRLLTHFHAIVSTGRGEQTYEALNMGFASVRSDEENFYSFRLTSSFLRRGTVTILFDRSHNVSSALGFGYTSTQGGVEIGFRF